MKKWLIRLAKVELVLIFLVIIAGSVVRMTGSGMGCPDWPKCFGYLIPPTERGQLEWQPNRSFEKGQIIIVDESLRVARQDFVTQGQFQEANWAAYTKHDYALFNAFHTWVEYINRLLGALSGIPMLLLFIISAAYLRKNWRFFALSVAGLFMLGFEAWLGKLVVDGNLIPGSITIHMMGAFALVAILLLFRALLIKERLSIGQKDRGFQLLLIGALLMTIVQVILGTQVREQVDHLNEALVNRSSWIENLDWQFYVHRSFSILILVVNLWIWQLNRKKGLGFSETRWILALILGEVLLGVFLNYLGMPKFAQPLHLLLGSLLFGFQLFAVIKSFLATPEENLSISHSS